jgi:hypothetical protein
VYPMLPVSLECPFVIALSVFSDVYFVLNLLEVSVMIFWKDESWTSKEIDRLSERSE